VQRRVTRWVGGMLVAVLTVGCEPGGYDQRRPTERTSGIGSTPAAPIESDPAAASGIAVPGLGGAASGVPGERSASRGSSAAGAPAASSAPSGSSAAGAHGASNLPGAPSASSAPSGSSAGRGSASAPPAAPGAATRVAATAGTIWAPKPGVTWQWQLTGAVDTSIDVEMYDIDLFMSSSALIETLHRAGRVVVCYFSAGSYEPDRTDSPELAKTGLGSVLDGWPDERWVDIRSAAVRDVMKARLDLAVSRGCDGVEPDNVDAFDNENGLGLTAQDQIDFNLFLASEAHARGLSIGLKNTLALVPSLVHAFDWALNEECLQFGECASLEPFLAAGKAVFHCEYTESTGTEVDAATDVDTGEDEGGIDAEADADGENDLDEGMNTEEDEDEDEEVDADTASESDEETEEDADADADEDTEGDADPDSDSDLEPYVDADPGSVCASRPVGFSTIVKNLDLDAYRLSCD
jgi:hypothetical protein